MNSVYDKKWSPYQIVITIACILMIVVTLLPVLNIVAISLSGKNAIAKGLVGVWPKEFTLEAYKMVFQNNNIVHSLFYSIFLTLGSALLSTFMTILAAYPRIPGPDYDHHVCGRGYCAELPACKRTASDEYNLGSGPARNDQSV